MAYAVSPNYMDHKLSSNKIEDMIDVYDDQIKGWLFSPTQLMTSNRHSGFAILTLVLTYFEPIGQFLTGQKGVSSDQFETGIKSVIPSFDPSIPRFIFDEL
jgi:hypothetical protein